MSGQMQNVGRMDREQSFFVASFAVKSVDVQPQPANFLISSSLSFCVPVKLSKLQSSTSLFSLPRIDFEPPSEERSSALTNIVEARPKSGLANSTTSLAIA